jgi:hypothetical protein
MLWAELGIPPRSNADAVREITLANDLHPLSPFSRPSKRPNADGDAQAAEESHGGDNDVGGFPAESLGWARRRLRGAGKRKRNLERFQRKAMAQGRATELRDGPCAALPSLSFP